MFLFLWRQISFFGMFSNNVDFVSVFVCLCISTDFKNTPRLKDDKKLASS